MLTCASEKNTSHTVTKHPRYQQVMRPLALSVLLATAFFIPGAFATTSGVDTPDIAISLPLAVGGNAVVMLCSAAPCTISPNINSQATFAGSVTVNGASVTAASYLYSDERLKTDIRPVPHALDKILALKGVEFNWKQDNRPDLGVVAQNVAATFPELVHKDSNGILSVEYGNLIGPMIEAVRELKSENDGLKQEIKQIRAEIKEIKQSKIQNANLPLTPQKSSGTASE